MNAAPLTPSAPDNRAAIFDAIAQTMTIAADYSEMVARFAAHRDPRGCAYAARCATAALPSANDLIAEVRPVPAKGGRAA